MLKIDKILYGWRKRFKDTHREKKALSNKTPALTKSKNVDNWVVDISNQFFIGGSLTETKFSKQ